MQETDPDLSVVPSLLSRTNESGEKSINSEDLNEARDGGENNEAPDFQNVKEEINYYISIVRAYCELVKSLGGDEEHAPDAEQRQQQVTNTKSKQQVIDISESQKASDANSS